MFTNKSQVVSLLTSGAAFAAILGLALAQNTTVSDHAHMAQVERFDPVAAPALAIDAGLRAGFDACDLPWDRSGTSYPIAASGC